MRGESIGQLPWPIDGPKVIAVWALHGICEYGSQKRCGVASQINFAARSGTQRRELGRDFGESLHGLRIKKTGLGWWRWLVHASDPINAEPYWSFIQSR